MCMHTTDQVVVVNIVISTSNQTAGTDCQCERKKWAYQVLFSEVRILVQVELRVLVR
jgi:hypothetical protein